VGRIRRPAPEVAELVVEEEARRRRDLTESIVKEEQRRDRRS
jgi:hypothetical protein